MTPNERRPMLSLAAGTILDLAPPELVTTAHAAGFAAVGVRLDATRDCAALVRETRRRLDDTGLRILDVEVARLLPGADATAGDEANDLLVEYGAELGAAHLLVVSLDEDVGRTTGRFARLCERAAAAGIRAALEFMVFTAVKTLDRAVAIVEAAGHPAGSVLVDALHLVRSGRAPPDIARVPVGRMPYIQISDALHPRGDSDEAACAHEARNERLMPGTGKLPVVELVRIYLARPDAAAISVEVQSAALARRLDPAARARLAWRSASTVLDRAQGRGNGRAIRSGA